LTQHLSAFANYPNGGIPVYGIDNQTATPRGVQQLEAESIVGQLANLGRDALDPPVAIDHAIADHAGHALLFVLVKESKVKPVHLRGKSFDHCYIRSGGAFEILNLGKYEWQHYIGVNPNLREEEHRKQIEEKEAAFLDLTCAPTARRRRRASRRSTARRPGGW
jgi:hypothetical protein